MGLLRFGRPHRAVRVLGSWLAAGVLIGSQLAVPVAQAAPVAPAAAPAAAQAPAALVNPTNTIDVSVISARTEPKAFGGDGVNKGAPITDFKYIINLDNTGTTTQRSANPGSGCSTQDAGYPDSCEWVSIAGVPGSSPIYTQGTQADFPLDLPNGRYLISVIADGFKLDGALFTIPMESPGLVTVELQPTPLPTATIRARVFEDNDPVNGAPDEPGENGLAGFKARLMDYIGEVSTDVFGNPLCSSYETNPDGTVKLDPPDYEPTLVTQGDGCYSDANGDIVIPNMGTNRYAMSVTPPIGSNWVQTTTLEGNHDWDTWVMEGATGFDTEFVVAGEPFPPVIFGFVKPTNTFADGTITGEIKGSVLATKAYIPPTGGVSGEPGIFGGKVAGPIVNPWIALSDLNNGDVAVYIGQGDANGAFDITNVPDGSYTLTYWDEPQDYILGVQNVTVVGGEIVDVGDLHALGWWTQISGHVFNDLNENGKMDPGEPGLANFPVSMKKRENSLMDRGAVTVFTDSQGYYFMENAYPITQWLVEEVYADQFKTTGVTYQADNQPDETTVLGAGVDISVLPIIGLGGRVDWGVKAYSPGENGGIVGTVSYDTTRNELDPRYAAVEAWQPGVPDLTVDLYAPIPCGTNARGSLQRRTGTSSWPPAPTPAPTRRASSSTPTSPRTGSGQRAASPATWTATRSSTAPTRTCCRSARMTPASRDRSWACSSRPTRPTRMTPRMPTSAPPSTATTASATAASTGPSTPRTRRTRSARRHLRAADPGRLPGQGRDPERRQWAPHVQGHQGRGHQHLPRRPVRPPGPAAGLRRAAPHRGRQGRWHRRPPVGGGQRRHR